MPAIAVRTHVADPALQAYIQRHPFLTGPDEALNRLALEAIRAGTRLCAYGDRGELIERPAAAFELAAPAQARARRILRASRLDDAAIESAFEDFAWRVWPVPESARCILAIGCGEGHELAFLRAKSPDARILAIDYVEKLLPGLVDAAGIEFECCDIVSRLAGFGADFDLVFSNHTLEHMFEPERVLRMIRACLGPGGQLVSGLPLDGEPGVPLLERVIAMANRPATMDFLDMGVFDPGHPWKTNAADLRRTLTLAGFDAVRIHQRADRPWRSARRHRPGAAAPALPGWLHALLLAPLRLAVRQLPYRQVPLGLRRGLQALERRLFFGANRLKNGYAPDVVFSAGVPDRRSAGAEGEGPP